MSKQKPELSIYKLPPEVAPAPSGFSVIGKWHKQDQPDRTIEFQADFEALFSGKNTSWSERYGNYYMTWKDGIRTRIEILDWDKISLSKDTYIRDSKVPSVVPTAPDLSKDWLRNRHETIAKTLADSAELGKNDVVFVGDSITQGWNEQGLDVWNQSFAGKPWKGLNLGVSGDRTDHLLFRLQSKEDGGAGNLTDPAINPKVIVLMIGTNNLFTHAPEQIIAGVISCKTRLQKLRPEARIVLCSVLPVKDPAMNRNAVNIVNSSLRKMHMPPAVFWLDLHSHFVDEGGLQKAGLFKDNVHLNTAGYQQWHDLLAPAIADLTQ